MRDDFWERSEVVEEFAGRAPDHRLTAMMDGYALPASVRVLDLGCAGGRNTLALAERGFAVWAIDASSPMVERTRERLVPVLGSDTARDRVRIGQMDDLSSFADGWFDLVIALGVYHNAESRAEWEHALAETARVLGPGGRLLVNHFTPEVNLTGAGARPLAGSADVYEEIPGQPMVLVDATALDAAMARQGLLPELPSATVRVTTEKGQRVSVNALYRRE